MDTDLVLPTNGSDDDYDWEEIETSETQPQTIEITLNPQPKIEEAKKKKSGISYADRVLRLNCHKLHTVALLANAGIRNRWLNDELLHARLLSLCPLKLHDSFATIHKSRIPNPNQRGRMFENAIHDLTHWWSRSFKVTPTSHIRNYTFDQVEKILERYRQIYNSNHENDNDNDDDHVHDLFGHSEMDLDILQDVLGEKGECIRSPKSLMKHALMGRGSRDISAQLFTALCRALAIPARLVTSLQSMPWQASIGKPKPYYTRKKNHGKSKGTSVESTFHQASEHGEEEEQEHEHEQEESDGDEDMEEVEIPSVSSSVYDVKGKGKATSFTGIGQQLDGSLAVGIEGKEKEKTRPPIKLRKTRPQGRRLYSASPSASSETIDMSPDPRTTPPVFWTEVFSKADGKWLPVDPIRSIVNKRNVFDPSRPTNAAAVVPFSRLNPLHQSKKPFKRPTSQDNRLLYVLAFEEDGYAKDVTRRYAREYGTKVAKMQGGSGAAAGGKGRSTWWNHVLSLVRRPYRLHRDDIEDEELEMAQLLEGMPTTMAGFKDHPVYVLLRHLKQNETLDPPPPSTPELGKFRGEPVYPRSAVISLKTAENWMRSEGRRVKMGELPLKMGKARAGTVTKLREIEMVREEVRMKGEGEDGDGEKDVMQGLYARSQTEVYVSDPVIDGIVPKNNYGNIDLYTPSMLPHGGVHIPHKGIAKIAKKLGFDFAEAVTRFEFKKRRAFPVLEGIVIAKENEEVLLEAFWESERIAQEKARMKREEKVIQQWTRLIQGLRIRQKLQEQYGPIQKPKGDEVEESVHDLVQPDDVVQAFHLPKSHHHHHHHQSVPDLFPSRKEVDLVTYDFDDDHDDHDVAVDNNATTLPKTMAELAENTESFGPENGLKRNRVEEGEEDSIQVKKSRVTQGAATRTLRPRR